VNNSRQRLAAKDYKHGGKTQGSGFDFARYQQFGLGLGLGLIVALGVWLYGQRAQPANEDELAEVTAPEDRADKKSAAKKSAAAETTDDPSQDYTFYDALPKFEVTLPERESGARRDLPDQPVAQPGAYVLQVASVRNRPDAERLRDKLGKLGIDATVQHVAIDTDEWHRVRIGPISDLNKLNATRRQLRAADIDAIIYRVGD
jgi:cell division protein FtsN